MASRLFAKLSRIRSIAPVNLKTRVPRCSAYAYGQARRDHASAEVVARTGGSTAGQLAALSNRHGGLRRCASSESQAANAWTRRSAYAGEVRAPVFEGTEERF